MAWTAIGGKAAGKAAGVGLSTGATLGIAAGVFAAEQLLKHYIGRGRKAADKWTGGKGGQDDFHKNVLEPAAIIAKTDPARARDYVDQAWRTYLAAANDYAAKGSNQEKVIQQNLATPEFMSTVQSLLGKDPLAAEYTNQFLGGTLDKVGGVFGKVGGAIKSGGSAVLSGLGKVLGKLGKLGPAPTSAQTPPYVPGGQDPRMPQQQQSGGDTNWTDLLIKGGALAGSSILGSKLAQSPPSDLEKAQLERAGRVGDRGEAISGNLFDMGQPANQQAIDYWSSILSSDRSKITSTLAPEIGRIGEGYQAAAQTSAALNPRGGPTPDFLAQAPYMQQRDVSTLFQQARPDAAKQLAGSGSNLLANAINALHGSTAAGRDVLNFEQQRRTRDREAGTGIGRSIFDIFYPAQGQKGLGAALGGLFGTGSR